MRRVRSGDASPRDVEKVGFSRRAEKTSRPRHSTSGGFLPVRNKAECCGLGVQKKYDIWRREWDSIRIFSKLLSHQRHAKNAAFTGIFVVSQNKELDVRKTHAPAASASENRQLIDLSRISQRPQCLILQREHTVECIDSLAGGASACI